MCCCTSRQESRDVETWPLGLPICNITFYAPPFYVRGVDKKTLVKMKLENQMVHTYLSELSSYFSLVTTLLTNRLCMQTQNLLPLFGMLSFRHGFALSFLFKSFPEMSIKAWVTDLGWKFILSYEAWWDTILCMCVCVSRLFLCVFYL